MCESYPGSHLTLCKHRQRCSGFVNRRGRRKTRRGDPFLLFVAPPASQAPALLTLHSLREFRASPFPCYALHRKEERTPTWGRAVPGVSCFISNHLFL